jgi:hypothetical protein
MPEQLVLHGELPVRAIDDLPALRHKPDNDPAIEEPRTPLWQPSGKKPHENVQADVHADSPIESVQWRQPAARAIDFAAVLGEVIPPPRYQEELLEVVVGFLFQDLVESLVPAEVLFNPILRADRQAHRRNDAEAAQRAASGPQLLPVGDFADDRLARVRVVTREPNCFHVV